MSEVKRHRNLVRHIEICEEPNPPSAIMVLVLSQLFIIILIAVKQYFDIDYKIIIFIVCESFLILMAVCLHRMVENDCRNM